MEAVLGTPTLFTVGIALAVLATTSCGSSSPSVDVIDATQKVQNTLLGENWTAGTTQYEVLAAAQAFSEDRDFVVTAARIHVDGMEVTLFWRESADGGLIIGDARTRRYSIWGAAATPGSPADQLVVEARSSAAGQAVLSEVASQP